MLRVYNWMTSGLLLTGIVAYGVANTSLHQPVLSPGRDAGWLSSGSRRSSAMASIFAPLVFVMVLSFGVNRLSRPARRRRCTGRSAAAMGASLTNIFLIYTGDLASRGCSSSRPAPSRAMSLCGYTTRTDLTRFGSFLFMGLIGIVHRRAW